MSTPFNEPPKIRRAGFFARLRSSFFTGIVVIAPVALTVWLLWSVIGWIDGFVLPFVPNAYHPETLVKKAFGPDATINIRGVGVVFFLFFTVFVGWLAKGIFGRSMIRFGESLVARMPVVRSIYSGLKQIAETVFSQSDKSFEKACLIQYPRPGIWAIGFVSTPAKGEIARQIQSDGSLDGEIMSIFLPTTPNPTSGFLLYVPRKDVVELDMTVEDAAKLIISAGLVYPGQKPTEEIDG